MNYKTVYSLLKEDLIKIEQELEKVLESNSELLKSASLHYLHAGGKRIRPVLVLLSSKFGEYQFEKIKCVAVSLELIHMASLIHDDVIDNADLRRGKPTVKALWDNRIAMYTGDFIFARSLELISNLENEKVHQILADTMVNLTIGEIEQIRDKYNFNQTLPMYLRRIKRKTALLIAASCQLGALVANVEAPIHQKLYRFGYYAGMAFQITDDILDFISTEEKLGKPVGEDLLQGNITLPVLFALNDESVRDEIRQVHENMDPNQFRTIIERIKQTDAIAKSMEVSNQYLHKALKILDELPDNPTKPLLKEIILFIGKRKF